MSHFGTMTFDINNHYDLILRRLRGGNHHRVNASDKEGAKVLQRTYATEAEAKRAAGAARTRAARQPRSLDMTLAFSRADLFPECTVTTSGYKPEIDATRWLIAEVTHDMPDRGFITALKLEAA